MSTSDDDQSLDMFREPDDFYRPEAVSTTAKHTLRSGETLTLRLVGSNPLWGHLLWNAGRTITDYLDDHSAQYVKGRNVLELGAGAGLPSLLAALRGAKQVVVTDYPDTELISNLQYNVDHCDMLRGKANIIATGHLWGSSAEDLLSHIPAVERNIGFQTLILADLLFNHSEHARLVQTIHDTLERSESSRALVFFTPYRPWLLKKDLAFFDVAKTAGFRVEKMFEKLMDKVMFEDDPGDEALRRTVYGYELRWADLQSSDGS